MLLLGTVLLGKGCDLSESAFGNNLFLRTLFAERLIRQPARPAGKIVANTDRHIGSSKHSATGKVY